MRPAGPDIDNKISVIINEMQDEINKLKQPGAPKRMASVALKTDLPDAGDYPECAVICDEIHSIAVSTLTGGVYTWKRADGSAL